MDKQDAKQSLIMLLEGAERLLVRFKPPTDEGLRELREQILTLLIESDPRTCTKVYAHVLSEAEQNKIYEESKGVIPQLGKLADSILTLVQQVIERDYVKLESIMPQLKIYGTYLPEPTRSDFSTWLRQYESK